MDFMNDFDPAQGDLLYGMAKARGAYLEAYEQWWPGYISKNGLVTMIDEYNTLFYDVTSSPGNTKFTAHDILNYFTTKKPIQKFKRKVEQETALAYWKAIKKHRHSPIKTAESYDKNKAKKEGFTNTTPHFDTGKTYVQEGYDIDALNVSFRAIRRACKFGIGFIAEDMATARPNARIRFVLDRFRMLGCFDKSLRIKLNLNNQAIPITYSELRYTYRNWDRFKDRVVFYMAGCRIAPPWEEDWHYIDWFGDAQKALMDHWIEYGKAVRAKHAADGKYGSLVDDQALEALALDSPFTDFDEVTPPDFDLPPPPPQRVWTQEELALASTVDLKKLPPPPNKF